MSTYCYTLRKATKSVNIDGEFQAIPQFEFAHGNVGGWSSRERDRAIAAQFAAAERAFDQFAQDGYVLALDGEWVVLTRTHSYDDCYGLEERHAVVVGRVRKVGNRLHCVAQNTTVELARNSMERVSS